MKKFFNKFKKKSKYKWIVTTANNKKEDSRISIQRVVITTPNPTLSENDLDIFEDDGVILSIIPVGMQHPEHFYFWKAFICQSLVFFLYITFFGAILKIFNYLGV